MKSTVKHKISIALADANLGQAVIKACQHSTAARNRVIAELENLPLTRKTARSIRQFSLDNIDSLLSSFERNFTSAGGIVHHASDAQSACRKIIEILNWHNARRGVKSKSMVAEEIGLGEALHRANINAIESDLGEFIVQLAGETPSHITAPALHRSRQSVGRLFAEKLGISYTDNPAELTSVARTVLRERYISAQFGLAGANFLIAETGHILLVENEGNARMGLSAPPLFISITGIEKVISSLSDIAPLLKLLPRSATGQRMSAYVHLLRPYRKNEDGPREMHIVLVDNGRRRALLDPIMREMLLCIRCGACLNICPVYRTTGGHAYDSVYPGPMGAVLSNLLGEHDNQHQELAHLSTLCGVCKEICPVDIDIPRMLLELRARTSKPLLHRTLAKGWKWMMKNEIRYRIAGRALKIIK